MSLRYFILYAQDILEFFTPWHDDFCHKSEWRNRLRANIEVVGKVNFGLAPLLVDLETIVLYSDIDVSQSKFHY